MYEVITKVAPNIPEEVIKLWLLPFANERGFPPPSTDKWDIKITGETIAFWNDACWDKVNIDLSSIEYSKSYFDVMRGLNDAYNRGVKNDYWEHLGEDGKKRYNSFLVYILKNRKFPQPPILTINDVGKYEVLDGNHRFFGFVSAEKIYAELKSASPEQKQSFLKTLKVLTVEPPHITQEVWVCKPKWENSQNAKTRACLRSAGFGD
ncbi:MAG: hypothetical protein AAB562_02225 [Patescibacteria group bacterium]